MLLHYHTYAMRAFFIYFLFFAMLQNAMITDTNEMKALDTNKGKSLNDVLYL